MHSKQFNRPWRHLPLSSSPPPVAVAVAVVAAFDRRNVVTPNSSLRPVAVDASNSDAVFAEANDAAPLWWAAFRIDEIDDVTDDVGGAAAALPPALLLLLPPPPPPPYDDGVAVDVNVGVAQDETAAPVAAVAGVAAPAAAAAAVGWNMAQRMQSSKWCFAQTPPWPCNVIGAVIGDPKIDDNSCPPLVRIVVIAADDDVVSIELAAVFVAAAAVDAAACPKLFVTDRSPPNCDDDSAGDGGGRPDVVDAVNVADTIVDVIGGGCLILNSGVLAPPPAATAWLPGRLPLPLLPLLLSFAAPLLDGGWVMPKMLPVTLLLPALWVAALRAAEAVGRSKSATAFNAAAAMSAGLFACRIEWSPEMDEESESYDCFVRYAASETPPVAAEAAEAVALVACC